MAISDTDLVFEIADKYQGLRPRDALTLLVYLHESARDARGHEAKNRELGQLNYGLANEFRVRAQALEEVIGRFEADLAAEQALSQYFD